MGRFVHDPTSMGAILVPRGGRATWEHLPT